MEINELHEIDIMQKPIKCAKHNCGLYKNVKMNESDIVEDASLVLENEVDIQNYTTKLDESKTGKVQLV